ncbi:hypothetical protein CRV100 [Nile crocodilepox virus]|uniref:Uncharacterized protein n=1 Tax=Nile crocodilepox virus (isolate Crocodylus niloticus/Zimbabwe/Ume/2001) TaxID=1289473 RepID=Q070F1_CPRVZ|nr:hypothetical protein CRV100 [Nile crocodilepox virus]ABJ08991.1 hypothetical protein CRV100 [Nile crocodilepox virus]
MQRVVSVRHREYPADVPMRFSAGEDLDDVLERVKVQFRVLGSDCDLFTAARRRIASSSELAGHAVVYARFRRRSN